MLLYNNLVRVYELKKYALITFRATFVNCIIIKPFQMNPSKLVYQNSSRSSLWPVAAGVTQVKHVGWSIEPQFYRRMWRGMRSRPDAIAQISLYPGAGPLGRSATDMSGHLKQLIIGLFIKFICFTQLCSLFGK